MKELLFYLNEGLDKKYYPTAKTKKSAGMDVRTTKGVTIKRFESARLGTGVKIKSIDDSRYLDLEIRSGKRFINLLSTLGTGVIDGDFTNPDDEIEILIFNFGPEITINEGERIGQLILKENLTQKEAARYCQDHKRKSGIGSTSR